MEIEKSYVVYTLNEVMNSESHMALEKVYFKDWTLNKFESEEDAIQALISNGNQRVDYIILTQIRIL